MILAAFALLFLAGASVGSFLNVVADRVPAGESLLHPPSHCPSCNRRLTAWELSPVFSFLGLRGKCIQCHAAIPVRVMLVELVAGLLAVGSWWTFGLTWAGGAVFLLGALFLVLALIDLELGIIADWFVYPGLALAFLLAPWWAHLGVERTFLGSDAPLLLLAGSVVGAGLGAGVFSAIILARPGSMGWGDVTMAALIGGANGMPGTFVGLVIAVVTGGLVAAALLALGAKGRKQSIPFGPFLAFGGVIALLWGSPVWSWYRTL